MRISIFIELCTLRLVSKLGVETPDIQLRVAYDIYKLGARAGAYCVCLDPVMQRKDKLASESEAAIVLKDSESTELIVTSRSLVHTDSANRRQRWGKPQEEVGRSWVESGVGQTADFLRGEEMVADSSNSVSRGNFCSTWKTAIL